MRCQAGKLTAFFATGRTICLCKPPQVASVLRASQLNKNKLGVTSNGERLPQWPEDLSQSAKPSLEAEHIVLGS